MVNNIGYMFRLFFVLMDTNIDKKGYRYTKMEIGNDKIGIYTYYPNATSSTIINAKPMAKAMVGMLEWLPLCDSGISSSTTT